MTVLSYSLTLTIGLGLGVVAMKFHYGWQLAMWKKAHAELEFAYAQLFAKQTRAQRDVQVRNDKLLFPSAPFHGLIDEYEGKRNA